MTIKKGVLKNFDSGDYTATIRLSGSDRAYLEDVAVSRGIPAAEMVAGRALVVVFFEEHNAKEAVVTGVFTR
jgi:hypothetical protein